MHRSKQSQSYMQLPTATSLLSTQPRRANSNNSLSTRPNSADDLRPFQKLKVKKKLFFKSKKMKDGVLICKKNDLPTELSAPDSYCVGCPPCYGTLLKRHGIFWTLHEFEVWWLRWLWHG